MIIINEDATTVHLESDTCLIHLAALLTNKSSPVLHNPVVRARLTISAEAHQ